MRPRGLVLYLLGVFVGALDVNVLAPALPLIARSFSTTLAWTAWSVTAYTVAYAAATLLAGPFGDRAGHVRLFRVGLVLFGLASALAALSRSFPVFVLARALQGMGAGSVYPNAQAEGVRAFGPERRGLALGIFGAVFGVASIIGPNVGGALAQFFGWPAVFWFNAAAALTVLGASIALPEGERHPRPLPDPLGALSFAVLLACALLTLADTGSARLGLAALGLVSAAAFAWRQRRAKVPFLDPQPFLRSAGVALLAGAALIGMDMSAAVFVPALAQARLHLSVLDSGVSLMPAALSGAVLSGLGGMWTDRRGPRPVLVVGLVAGVVGGILLALPRLTWPIFGAAMVVFGLATAFTMGAPLNRLALGIYGEEQAAEALSMVAVFRSVGLAAGPVLLTAAEFFHGFTGMFLAVAVASLVGAVLFGRLGPAASPHPQQA